MKVTNISEGPRGLHTVSGTILTEPQQTVDVEMTDGEHASAYRSGWFDIPKPTSEGAVKALAVQTGRTDAQLEKEELDKLAAEEEAARQKAEAVAKANAEAAAKAAEEAKNKK